MIKLKLKSKIDRHIEDVERLIRILSIKNYWTYENEVLEAWKQLSKDIGLDWINLPKNDEECFKLIIQYFEEVSHNPNWIRGFYDNR